MLPSRANALLGVVRALELGKIGVGIDGAKEERLKLEKVERTAGTMELLIAPGSCQRWQRAAWGHRTGRWARSGRRWQLEAGA